MAAKCTVNTVVNLLVVLSVVASVLVAPVGASGDGTLDTDGDGVTIGTNNTSVSVADDGVTVESGDSSVAVSVDGVDTGDGSDGDSSPGELTRRADNQTLPVNYSDIPWGSLPVDVCSPPVDPTNPRSSPVNPEESPEQWPANQSWPVPDTVVNPNDPPGSPIGHCELFDPANPPFDPTDPPRDPGYTFTPYQTDPGRYLVAGEVTLDRNGTGPAVGIITGGRTTQNRTSNAQRTTVNDGQKDYVLYTGVDHEPGTREGDVIARPTVAGRSVDLSVVCADGNCTFSAGGTPAPSQRIPVGGGDGDSGGSGGDDSGATDDAESTAGSADASVSADAGTDGTAASASAGAGDVGVDAGVTLAELSSGLPDAATATGALLDQF